jgi:hypothetical protein
MAKKIEKKNYSKTHKSKKAVDSHAAKIFRRGGTAKITKIDKGGYKLEYSFIVDKKNRKTAGKQKRLNF